MEHIFLDTSIFIKENYLEGTRIKELLKLSKELSLKIIVTAIVVDEVKNNFRKSIQEVNQKIEAIRSGDGKYLKNLPAHFDVLRICDLEDVCSEFNKKFDEALVEANAVIVPYKLLDIQPVFDKYFRGDYPFKGKNKKAEFPDAISLKLVEDWCIENEIECTLFSMDSDLKNYSHRSFKIVDNYENYLTLKLNDIKQYHTRINFLSELYDSTRDKWSKTILNWVEDQLDDVSKLYDVVNGYEIHDVSDIEAELVKDSFEVIAVDDESITIEVQATVKYKVDILIDDEDSMFYDSDDKSYHYLEQKYYEHEDEDTLEVIFRVYLLDTEDYDEQFELLQINNDKKLELHSNWNDY